MKYILWIQKYKNKYVLLFEIFSCKTNIKIHVYILNPIIVHMVIIQYDKSYLENYVFFKLHWIFHIQYMHNCNTFTNCNLYVVSNYTSYSAYCISFLVSSF